MDYDNGKKKFEGSDGRGFRTEVNASGNMAGKSTTHTSVYSERSYIRVYEKGLETIRTKHIHDSPRTRREKESERLVRTAKDNGDYILYSNLSKFGVKVPQRSGESEVYVNELSSLVYKIKNPYSKAAIKPNVQPEDAILEHLVHNKYFPETSYHFEGITEEMGDRDGTFAGCARHRDETTIKRISMKKIFLAILLLITAVSTVDARQPKRGYRGFADWSNSLRRPQSWSGEGRYNEFYTGFSTSHGFQFNPNFYLGGGLGLEHNSTYDILPLFVHVRTDQKFGKFTPFADLRLGLNACSDYSGLYLSPSVGYRFNWGRKAGINLSLGYTLIPYKAHVYEIHYYDEPYMPSVEGDYGYVDWTWEYKGMKWLSNSYFNFRVGIDF